MLVKILTAVNLKPDHINDKHPIAIYTYDAGGARTIRYNLDHIDVSSNATEVGEKITENIMIYPSGLLMAKVIGLDVKANKMSYTKHYYIGSERVSAKTGTVDRLGIIPSVSFLNTHMPGFTAANIKTPSNTAVTDANTMVSGVYTKFELTKSLGVKALDDREYAIFTHNSALLNIFYFHPDHLGSSSYITNQDGTATQHMEYLPFGET